MIIRFACHSEESAILIGGRRPVAPRLWAAGRGISHCVENTQSEIPRFAPPKITLTTSFPRKRESTSSGTWTPALRQAQGKLCAGVTRRIFISPGGPIYGDFERDRGVGVWVEVSFPDMAFDVCRELARRYAARLGSRTLDTLHVAGALELKAERFWTFDERKAKLARAAGLKTE